MLIVWNRRSQCSFAILKRMIYVFGRCCWKTVNRFWLCSKLQMFSWNHLLCTEKQNKQKKLNCVDPLFNEKWVIYYLCQLIRFQTPTSLKYENTTYPWNKLFLQTSEIRSPYFRHLQIGVTAKVHRLIIKCWFIIKSNPLNSWDFCLV